jgi:acylphosphatase
MRTIHIEIRGHVQGVGFRAFTQRAARAAGVRGEVYNRPDGTVACVAQHEDDAVLSAFAERLRHGAGFVEDLAIREVEGAAPCQGFHISPTR